jgi:predicted RNA methylase
VSFRDELLAQSPGARDAWVDRRFGLEELPDDGPSLPPLCVPYLPSPVDVVLRMIEQADVRDSDVFIDVGMGVGRTGALVQLLTGATVVGVEVQPELAAEADSLARRLGLDRMTCVVADAGARLADVADGTVYYLYCPFGGERLERVLADLEIVAARRAIRICCLDLPLPELAWLTLDAVRAGSGDLTVYRSR